MSGEFVHSVRLLPGPARKDLRDIYRVYMPVETLKALDLKPGNLCQLQSPGREPAAAIAWDSPKIQRKVVQISEPLMEMHGFKHENRVAIQAIQPLSSILKEANTIVVMEILSNADVPAELHVDDKCSWTTLIDNMLHAAETVSVGLVLDSLRWRDQIRSFKLVKIDGSMCADTLYRFTSSPTLRSSVVIGANSLTNGVQLSSSPSISEEGIAGVSNEVGQINKSLRLYSDQPRRRKEPIDMRKRGILLYGPSGCGKSLILRKIAEASWKKSYTVDLALENCETPSIHTAIDASFRDAKKLQPSVIILDHLEDSPLQSLSGSTRAVIRALLKGFESVKDSRVLVVAATSNTRALSHEPRLSNYFDLQVPVSSPDAKARSKILKTLIETPTYTLDETLDAIGERAHGYVGGDLFKVARLAVEIASDRANDLEDQSPAEIFCTMDDFDDALTKVPPSVMRDAYIEVPKVPWSDIGGGDHVKKALKQAVEWPLKVRVYILICGWRFPVGYGKLCH